MNTYWDGQWLGALQSSTEAIGTMLLNVEFIDGNYRGRAIVLYDNANRPSFVAEILLVQSKSNIIFNLSQFVPIDPDTWLPSPSLDMTTLKLLNNFPTNGTIVGQLNNNNMLIGNITTDTTGQDNFSITPSKAYQPSQYISVPMNSWEDFRDHVAIFNVRKKYIFRGQPGLWRLRTSYHRTGRCDLIRYNYENVPELRRYICGSINRLFNLSNDEENGALLNLAQHHGYPTPLLDWTWSPYVAAYFAFANLSETSVSVLANPST